MESSESVASFASVTTVTGSVVESSSSDCEGSREAANSLLSKLRAPKRSDLTRKGKIRQNQSMRVTSRVKILCEQLLPNLLDYKSIMKA